MSPPHLSPRQATPNLSSYIALQLKAMPAGLCCQAPLLLDQALLKGLKALLLLGQPVLSGGNVLISLLGAGVGIHQLCLCLRSLPDGCIALCVGIRELCLCLRNRLDGCIALCVGFLNLCIAQCHNGLGTGSEGHAELSRESKTLAAAL